MILTFFIQANPAQSAVVRAFSRRSHVIDVLVNKISHQLGGMKIKSCPHHGKASPGTWTCGTVVWAGEESEVEHIAL